MAQPARQLHFLVRKVDVTLTISCDLELAHCVWLESKGQAARVEARRARCCALLISHPEWVQGGSLQKSFLAYMGHAQQCHCHGGLW